MLLFNFDPFDFDSLIKMASRKRKERDFDENNNEPPSKKSKILVYQYGDSIKSFDQNLFRIILDYTNYEDIANVFKVTKQLGFKFDTDNNFLTKRIIDIRKKNEFVVQSVNIWGITEFDASNGFENHYRYAIENEGASWDNFFHTNMVINDVWSVAGFKFISSFDTKLVSLYQRVSGYVPIADYPLISLSNDKFIDIKTFKPCSSNSSCYHFLTRSINEFEKRLFKVIEETDIKEAKSKFFIRKPKAFLNILNKEYFSHLWSKAINWDKWVMGGNCVLQCLTGDGKIKTDIDFYAIGISGGLFFSSIHHFMNAVCDCNNVKLRVVHIIHSSEYRIKLIYVKRNPQFREIGYYEIIKEIFIHFRWFGSRMTIKSLASYFDMEICKCFFDGKDILVSYCWMHAIISQSTISFKLVNNVYDMLWFMERIVKFAEYGYKLLAPKNLSVSMFRKALGNYKKIERFGVDIIDDCDDIKWNWDAFGQKKAFLQCFFRIVGAEKDAPRIIIRRGNKKYNSKILFENISSNGGDMKALYRVYQRMSSNNS